MYKIGTFEVMSFLKDQYAANCQCISEKEKVFLDNTDGNGFIKSMNCLNKLTCIKKTAYRGAAGLLRE